MRLADVVGPGTALGRLAAEADSRMDLAAQMRALLPEELRAGISACNLRDDGTLVVLSPSSEWAARLRFEGETLLAGCRKFRPETARLRLRVERNGSPEQGS